MPWRDPRSAAALDFTSALYLGMRHESASLPGWSSLTAGVPAALGEPPLAHQVAARLAALVGTERAVLLTSSLHGFWDLFGQLDGKRTFICWDEGAYPVSGWGIERARALGVPSRPFAHLDPAALAQALARIPARGRRPLVVTDGFCPGCGRPAPLDAYAEVMARFGGTLLVDDTQSLGIWGEGAHIGEPLGHGGGGSLRRLNLAGRPDVVLVASLAKGFGAPLAFLAGSGARIHEFVERSDTRIHCSPPSAAAVGAAARALVINARQGEPLRQRLYGRILDLCGHLHRLGLRSSGGIAPVQRVPLPGRLPLPPAQFCRRLRERGLRVLLQSSACGPGQSLTLILTARHQPWQVAAATKILHEELHA